MFHYAQGRFSGRLLSFAIPEKYYLNAESTDDDTMELLSPDLKDFSAFCPGAGLQGYSGGIVVRRRGIFTGVYL